MGDKFDKSFNQGVYNRVQKFAKESGVKYRKFDTTNETQPGQAIPRITQRGGNPVLSVGFAQASAAAKEFPNVRFPLIDMVIDLPKAQSIVFKEKEGSFKLGIKVLELMPAGFS